MFSSEERSKDLSTSFDIYFQSRALTQTPILTAHLYGLFPRFIAQIGRAKRGVRLESVAPLREVDAGQRCGHPPRNLIRLAQPIGEADEGDMFDVRIESGVALSEICQRRSGADFVVNEHETSRILQRFADFLRRFG